MMTFPTSRRRFLVSGGMLAGGGLLPVGSAAMGQMIDRSRTRVITNLSVNLPYLGHVRARSTAEIGKSNWLIGCETLDRDYTDYEKYKDYIAPLGIKRIRLQGGWAKTEKVQGQHDFAWLDRIIEDAARRGLQPWLQTSYGNPIYPGGGGANLGAGLPTSPAALAAYDRWVTAMVMRYRDRVVDWEVWNEPNFADNTINSPEATADFNIRTAEILKRHQPDAKISGLALGHYSEDFVARFFDRLAKKRKFDLFDTMTYHDYVYNPDFNVPEVERLRAALQKHTSRVRLRQGENGAPSSAGAGGALYDYPWTELTQAKWNTRRMLGNLGLDIESSVFSLAEINYRAGPITRLNSKGILKVDPTDRVVRPKTAYYAIQNVTALFDDTLDRIRTLRQHHNLASLAPGENAYSVGTDRRVAVFGYRHRTTGKHAYTLWQTENIPVDVNVMGDYSVSITNAEFERPVWVDIVSGAVHEIPAVRWTMKGNVTTFEHMPIYDAPIVIADRSLIGMIA